MELISILMPTYNVEKYVEEAVESILKQTYSKFELIIVDDYSTDGTYEILSRLAIKDKRIRLFRNDKNRKICATLNFALQQAKGQYIARMDGDDVSRKDRLEVLKSYLDLHPQIALVGSNSQTINEEGKIISRKQFLQTDLFIGRCMPVMNSVLHIWLARREIYDALGGYREVPYVEDYDFLLRGIGGGYRYANVADCLYSVRIRENNTQSSNGIYQQKAKYYIKKLNKKERRTNLNLFNEIQYKNAINSTAKEEVRYKKAYEFMRIGINRENSLFKRCVSLVGAMLTSKFFFYYVCESLFVRFMIVLERFYMNKSREKGRGN